MYGTDRDECVSSWVFLSGSMPEARLTAKKHQWKGVCVHMCVGP